jgi:acetyltransferase
MINSLKVAPLFKGYRGADKLDVEALADLIVSVGKLAADNEEIYELDINPLFVYAEGKGVGVADALVVVDALAEADNN